MKSADRGISVSHKIDVLKKSFGSASNVEKDQAVSTHSTDCGYFSDNGRPQLIKVTSSAAAAMA